MRATRSSAESCIAASKSRSAFGLMAAVLWESRELVSVYGRTFLCQGFALGSPGIGVSRAWYSAAGKAVGPAGRRFLGPFRAAERRAGSAVEGWAVPRVRQPEDRCTSAIDRAIVGFRRVPTRGSCRIAARRLAMKLSAPWSPSPNIRRRVTSPVERFRSAWKRSGFVTSLRRCSRNKAGGCPMPR